MRVSKLLILCSLALLAAMLYVATPAIALEHPWEEGEHPGTGGSDNPGTSDPFPGSDTTSTPFLTTGAQGSVFWWFELIIDRIGDNKATQKSSVVTPADTRKTSTERRVNTSGSMK